MAYPYALVIATPEGPRSKVNPNSVLIGPDSAHPDAVAQQYTPEHGPNFIAGKYTAHPTPWLTARQAHALTYLIRVGSFTPAEVLKMADALRVD